jgi:hypothetical protein
MEFALPSAFVHLWTLEHSHSPSQPATRDPITASQAQYTEGFRRAESITFISEFLVLYISYLPFFFLGSFELRVLHLPGRCSTTQATPPALVIF